MLTMTDTLSTGRETPTRPPRKFVADAERKTLLAARERPPALQWGRIGEEYDYCGRNAVRQSSFFPLGKEIPGGGPNVLRQARRLARTTQTPANGTIVVLLKRQQGHLRSLKIAFRRAVLVD
jgi:hypothetical protein